MFILLALVVSFLITAGLVWLLPAIGITFTIVFSWKLALAIIALLRGLFVSKS